MILQAGQRENSKKGFLKMKIKVLFLLVITILNATGATIDTAQIDQLTGLKGRLNEKEGAYKISFTREDVTVFVDGWKIPAFMGLSTWAAFTKATHSEAMVMGDTVLLEDEVNLAMFVALESGLSGIEPLLIALRLCPIAPLRPMVPLVWTGLVAILLLDVAQLYRGHPRQDGLDCDEDDFADLAVMGNHWAFHIGCPTSFSSRTCELSVLARPVHAEHRTDRLWIDKDLIPSCFDPACPRSQACGF